MKKFLAMILALAMLLSLAACAPAAADETTAASNETTAANDGTTAGDETTAAEDDTTAAGNAIKVIVVHADGSEKVFEYITDQEFLGALLQDEGLIEGNDGPYGLEITTVDGEKAVYTEDNAYWALYENGEYALQGVDTTPIVDGGEYKLEYTPA